MKFAPIIFTQNYFDKFAEEFSLFLKCSFFVEYFIILEKNVFEKKEKSLENVYMVKKTKSKCLICSRFYRAKLPTMYFMQSKECSEIIT